MADAIATLEVARSSMLNAARVCDLWAAQSRGNGWSTHQVDANWQLANRLRADADQITQQLEKL